MQTKHYIVRPPAIRLRLELGLEKIAHGVVYSNTEGQVCLGLFDLSRLCGEDLSKKVHLRSARHTVFSGAYAIVAVIVKKSLARLS